MKFDDTTKLDDQAIAQIVAIFDAEIAELERELDHNAVQTPAPETDSIDNQPVVLKDQEVDETDILPTQVVEEMQPETEIEQLVDETGVSSAQVVAEPALDDTDTDTEDSAGDDPANTEVAEDLDLVDNDTAATEGVPVNSDPAKPSTVKNILGAIGYILAIAAICALSVIAVNLLNDQVQSLQPVAPPEVAQSDLAASLQTYTANAVIEQEAVAQPSLQQIYSMDLRKPSGATEADLKKVTKAGLVGLEDTFLQAEKQYGVNAIFLMSIASLESAHGTMMYRPNNMFGYGGKSYPSKEACIMDVASGLSSRYLKPGGSLYGGSPTLKGVNKRYAANPQWYAKVGKYMKSYYDVVAPYHNKSLEKIK